MPGPSKSHAQKKWIFSGAGSSRARGRTFYSRTAPNFELLSTKNWEILAFKEGMTLALEPMINEGGYEIYLAEDGWTYKTLDGKLNGHWEHTVAVTKDGCEILTRL